MSRKEDSEDASETGKIVGLFLPTSLYLIHMISLRGSSSLSMAILR